MNAYMKEQSETKGSGSGKRERLVKDAIRGQPDGAKGRLPPSLRNVARLFSIMQPSPPACRRHCLRQHKGPIHRGITHDYERQSHEIVHNINQRRIKMDLNQRLKPIGSSTYQ